MSSERDEEALTWMDDGRDGDKIDQDAIAIEKEEGKDALLPKEPEISKNNDDSQDPDDKISPATTTPDPDADAIIAPAIEAGASNRGDDDSKSNSQGSYFKNDDSSAVKSIEDFDEEQEINDATEFSGIHIDDNMGSATTSYGRNTENFGAQANIPDYQATDPTFSRTEEPMVSDYHAIDPTWSRTGEQMVTHAKVSDYHATDPTWSETERRIPARYFNGKFPQDSYSFIALNGPGIDGSWQRKKMRFFIFGLVPFIFQMMFLLLLLVSKTSEVIGTIGETDNPDKEKDGIMAFFASFFPANATPIIRCAQVVSIMAYVIFPNSSLQDIIKSVQLFPQFSKKDFDDPMGCMTLSCILRLIQGTTAMIVTLLLVLTSNTVVDIILNFTAVNFISVLDEDAFSLALSGKFSPALRVEAEYIAMKDLPPCMSRKDESKWKWHMMVAGLVSMFLLGMMMFVFISQNSHRVWVTGILRVQFQEATGLGQYSGCFKINSNSSSVPFSRRIYHSLDTSMSNTSFGYCRNERRWVFFKGNTSDPCDASNSSQLALALSSKTDSFDISTIFEEQWVSTSNTPLDMYFFDGKDEAQIFEYCDSALGDGICDPHFNEAGYDYDGGDCCASTCDQSNCGRGGLTTAFGSNVSGDGFPSCTNPELFPIIIRLNSITSSRDPKFTGIEEYNDADQPRPWDNNEGQFIQWMEATPVSPFFALDCNGKNVLTVYIENSMVNKSQKVMVEDGAVCTLVVRNATTGNDILTDDPIWLVDYTLLHGNANGNEDQQIEILTKHSFEAEAINFKRIPECYFRKLEMSIDLQSFYAASGESSKKAIDWLLDDSTGNSECEDTNFIERYALVDIHFAINGTSTTPFISRDKQCTWPSITCSQGKVATINLQDALLEGDILSELSLLPSLEGLQLCENLNGVTSENIVSCNQIHSLNEISMHERIQTIDLSNSSSPCEPLPSELFLLTNLKIMRLHQNFLFTLPPEIRSLGNLQILELDENELTALPPDIGRLGSLQYLDLDENELTAIPPEIGSLVNLQTLHLGFNSLATLPSEVGNLGNLQTLYLYGNELTAVPSEIRSLSSLRILDLDGNQLTALPSGIWSVDSLHTLYLNANNLTALPSEIGRLVNLQTLGLDQNKFKTVPSEIGNFGSLQTFYLNGNELTSLPTEIGRLSNLQTLQLDGNMLNALPSEIGSLVDLQILTLGFNLLFAIPTEIRSLGSLQVLSLDGNGLATLPSEIGSLDNLQTVYLRENQLTALPPEIRSLRSLQALYLNGNYMTTLPAEVEGIVNLQTLDLNQNKLTSLRPEIGSLVNLKYLGLAENGLTSLPSEIRSLGSLQTLDLNKNILTSLAPEIGSLVNLDYLDLAENSLTALPPEIRSLESLETLYLYRNRLTTLPPEIGSLRNLQDLQLFVNGLTTLPSEIGNLGNLHTLSLALNQLTILPSEIGGLGSLQVLALNKNGLLTLPSEIGSLGSLQTLSLFGNTLTALPSEIGGLASLQTLSLNGNELTSLPAEIGSLSNLQKLELQMNGLLTLPSEIRQFISLETLYLHENELASLPPEIGSLRSLQALTLNKNELMALPSEIGSLGSLETLTLDENELTFLPPEIGGLASLQTLTLNENGLMYLPTEIGGLVNLQALYLIGNGLMTLPSEIGRLGNLRTLYLIGNELTSLPTEIGSLGSLQTLFLNDNKLTSLPSEIGSLVNLQTLHLGSNPLNCTDEIFDLCDSILCYGSPC